MHQRFIDVISSLDGTLDKLLACKSLIFGELPINMPMAGVFLFSQADRHLYVGRSNRLRARYFLHCRPGSRQNQASFAYKLAREKLGINRASYGTASQTRKRLAATPSFIDAFAASKASIRRMAYRYVEEQDLTRQALLEAYCAIVLETQYNDFHTH